MSGQENSVRVMDWVIKVYFDNLLMGYGYLKWNYGVGTLMPTIKTAFVPVGSVTEYLDLINS